MKSIKLPNTDLYVPRFIFSTASLFNAGNARERLSLLETAVDNGFSHFDTAPYYGFGMAERDLAPLLRRHPNLGVTTKVGLYSPGGEDQQSLSVLLRKGAGKLLPTLSRPVIDFTISRAQTALEGSLRRLRRESIEL